jgi:hypothetical protein
MGGKINNLLVRQLFTHFDHGGQRALDVLLGRDVRLEQSTHVLDFGIGRDVFGIVGEVFEHELEDDQKVFVSYTSR